MALSNKSPNPGPTRCMAARFQQEDLSKQDEPVVSDAQLKEMGYTDAQIKDIQRIL